jgi:hypothetical protein
MTLRDPFVCPKCRTDETYLNIIDGTPYVICYLCNLRWRYVSDERMVVLTYSEPNDAKDELIR